MMMYVLGLEIDGLTTSLGFSLCSAVGGPLFVWDVKYAFFD